MAHHHGPTRRPLVGPISSSATSAASGPNELWVADFSYLRCWEGLVFFAFVLDVYSRRIVGWQLAAHMRTDLVLDALRMALHRREPGADVELIHHSDRGCQYTSIDYTQTLADHRVLASVGSVGDAYDNALAESFVDSFKTELIPTASGAPAASSSSPSSSTSAGTTPPDLHESLGDIHRSNPSRSTPLRDPLRSQERRSDPPNPVPVKPGPAQMEWRDGPGCCVEGRWGVDEFPSHRQQLSKFGGDRFDSSRGDVVGGAFATADPHEQTRAGVRRAPMPSSGEYSSRPSTAVSCRKLSSTSSCAEFPDLLIEAPAAD